MLKYDEWTYTDNEYNKKDHELDKDQASQCTVYVCTTYVRTYVCVYVWRERDREKDREKKGEGE